MKIIIPGGTGQVGTILARDFHANGHEVVVLSRQAQPAPWRIVQWDARTVGPWAEEVEGADAIINLAGKTVNCRYTPKNRRAIKESRVESTRVVGQAIAQAAQPPRVWLQASTATIYAHRYDAANDEFHGLIGGHERNVPSSWPFSIDVTKAWEQAANEAETPHTRKILLRSAMIMSPDRDGIFDTLLRLVRFGLGGSIGDGRQYVSWIHDQDFISAIYWLLEHETIDGIINMSSPNPLPYAEFMRHLRAARGIRIGLPATKWMVEIGTFLMRTESELVLKSRRVVPSRLIQAGFEFQFPMWNDAAQDLVKRSNHQ